MEWVIGRGWKNFEAHARKSLHCHELTFKGGSGEGSEGEQKSCREGLSLKQDVSHPTLVGICMIKAFLMRSQMKMKNLLLDTRGKASLVIKWQRTWLSCAYSSPL